MAKIISIGTAVPNHCHRQKDILRFMQGAYQLNKEDSRKLSFLYRQSQIEQRHSVLPDFSPDDQSGTFFAADKPATLEDRMALFDQHAPSLAVQSIHDCIEGYILPEQITHLITVSCTGMSAPGLDLQIAELMDLPANIFRTSVNFMGCYAAIHGLRMANSICAAEPEANVVVVCTELCTIHFQQDYTPDNAASSLLFADGSSAVLVSAQLDSAQALTIQHFYAEVARKGKTDMSWQLGSNGFLMRLSAYIPHLIEEDIAGLLSRALAKGSKAIEAVTHWCIHPGGKKILEAIARKANLTESDLSCSRKVLAEYGNMSSPSILFVLKEAMQWMNDRPALVMGVAFGPGLTMETFTATKA